MSIRDSLKEIAALSPFNVLGTAKALSNLSRPPAEGGSGWGWGFWNGSGSRINFAQEVGPIQNVPLVQAGVNWVARGLNSARFQVVEVDSDSKETDLPDHPVAQLFHRPNPYYSGSALMYGIALNWLTRATSYILIYKNRMGQPAELWWEPWWTIKPVWPQNGSEIINHYEISRNGQWIPIGQGTRWPNIEVLVIPDGWDPATRRGWSAMAALMTEFYTDKQSAQFMAQLMRTGLVPPLIVGLGTEDAPFEDPDGTKVPLFKSELIRKMSGDSAGEPMVTQGAVNVQKLGFDYSSVGLKEIRQIPVTRFCAAMGVSAISLHLDAGDSTHANYNNTQGYLKHDYQSYIVNLQDTIADEVDRVLLPMFGDTTNLKCAWDYTKTPLMQADKVSETKRSALMFTTQIIDRGEAREINGYEARPEDKDVYYAGKPQGLGSDRFGNDPANPMSDGESKSWFDFLDANDLHDGLDWWKRSAPREARALAKAPVVKPNGGLPS